MNGNVFFGNAKWVSAKDADICPIMRKSFFVDGLKNAKINILGFSSFVFFINGVRGCEDYFLPLATDVEERNSPSGELLKHRVYVEEYDITDLLKNGKNVLAVMLGDGWYTGHTGKYKEIPYGEKKLCFRIEITDLDGTREIISDEDVKYSDSFVKYSDLNFGEIHDYSEFDEVSISPEYDDSAWHSVRLSSPPDTNFMKTDCPRDRITQRIKPTQLFRDADGIIYDVGKNITGFPMLQSAVGSSKVKIEFSEALSDGKLSERCSHNQSIIYKTGGKSLTLSPYFTWFGFRYFKVIGDAEPTEVRVIHSDVHPSSDFECDCEVINWLYRAYINTQLNNMHQGIPSDCPHIERRGYTGDGQLTSRASMLSLDAKEFYKKWIYDISDCQDSITGHVQYTAPYTHSGGGPGGWGSAIVRLPYEYLRKYGDPSLCKELYPQMLAYFNYLDSHSESGLVTSDREGEWCLGEWCVPASHPGDTCLPPQYVNSYFYVKALEMARFIAYIIGEQKDIPILEGKINTVKTAIELAYFNKNNGDFLGGREGANAFALDIGLGDERTKKRFISYYEKVRHFDTGIFATDIVTRLLFEYGRGDLAIALLTADTPHGFGKWMKEGATSLWEYWNNPRSMSHPMFGAVTSHLFEHILGIRQREGTVGYSDVIISPALNTPLGYAKGYISVNGGVIFVEYKKGDDEAVLTVDIPEGTRAEAHLLGNKILIKKHGRSFIKVNITKSC